MITFPYSSPLHLHVILIHIIQPTTHKTLLVACKKAKRIKMFGKYSKGNGNLHMAFKQESDIPKFAILNITPSACESALQ